MNIPIYSVNIIFRNHFPSFFNTKKAYLNKNICKFVRLEIIPLAEYKSIDGKINMALTDI